MKATLALEDGSWHVGTAAGATGEAFGEVVFNTGLMGYQEVLTDPSYAGQIVTMTCPHIGNYGTTEKDEESSGPRVAGFVVRELSPIASNWRSESALRDYLVRHGIVAITDVDTRALTRVLRSAGVMRGVVATGAVDPQELVSKARSIPPMEGADLVREVTCSSGFDWPALPEGDGAGDMLAVPPERRSSRQLRVAAYDFGAKRNILRRLAASGCSVRVYPASTPADVFLEGRPDGVLLSNGPGDPAAVGYAIDNVRRLVQSDVPVFGICLGHQILALALGARTFKLKFGHRGTNHPVKHVETGSVEITSQNHGFAVDPKSLPSDVVVTHVSLYDGTVEGLRHASLPVSGVQYHPEASPGPHDAEYLFGRFVRQMESRAR
jgi:carbamoyl-phosphate synthase small subunit